MKKTGVITLITGLLGLVGCVQVSPPDEGSLSVAVPADWDFVDDAGAVEDNWIEDFGDAQLERLVDEAFSGNLDLQAAVARLDQAVALARIEGADRWPDFALGGTARRQMSNTLSEPVSRFRSDRFDLSATTSWELDLWGRVRAQVKSANATAAAAAADFRAVRLSIAARIAQAWFNAIEARQQESLARETLNSFESNLETVEERFRRGLSPALDLRLTRANVASARATHAVQKRVADAAVRQLEVLLGRYPSGSSDVAEELPKLEAPVPAGVPSELLLRRPDIEAASQRVISAESGLIESKRALLPAIRLTGTYGRASDDLENLLDDGFDVWSLVGNLTAPIFQGGRLRANVDLSDARTREALVNYQNAALIAFREVETSLASETYLLAQLDAVRMSADESMGAQQLAEERYERGLVDIITVLESQRRAFNSRSAVISIQNLLLQNRVALYLSLGGDLP